mgnify:FL=1
MPELLVISGKGGTGKTSLTAAFAHLAREAVLCDLDVDAPDLHILLAPEIEAREDFISGHEAVIDPAACTGCGQCAERCRFGAVVAEGAGCRVDPLKCEGCKVCVHFCPAGAIAFPARRCGEWYRSRTRFGPLVHARLLPGAENSGRLVALLREKARELARSAGYRLILADGAPGIGCPVISSLSGVDAAVVVTEPTPSGIHDLERVIGLCRHFRVPAGVIVNKADLAPENTASLKSWAAANGIACLGELGYDDRFTAAMIRRQAVTECGDDGPAAELRRIWDRIQEWVTRQARAA